MVKKRSVILLVEDNESHALLARRGLAQFSEELLVVHVSDGEAALNYLYRRENFSSLRVSPRPDLVLLDLRLPKIDGIDVLKEIKQDQDLRSIPVVVLTSSLAEPDIVNAYYNYANSYLVKESDFNTFRDEMVEIARYWLNWNVIPL
ncbi:MAG: response regulator [Fibrobacter sp.]|nr:response regulator [Fibrobacter sp.]